MNFLFDLINRFEIHKARKGKRELAYTLRWICLERCVICDKYVDHLIGFRIGWPSDCDGGLVCHVCITRLVDEEMAWRDL